MSYVNVKLRLIGEVGHKLLACQHGSFPDNFRPRRDFHPILMLAVSPKGAYVNPLKLLASYLSIQKRYSSALFNRF